METLYDILGVVPSATHNEVVKAYQTLVRAELEGGDFKQSMWWWHRLEKIAEMTEAMKVLVHGDRRTAYNKRLLAACVICPLCEGRGFIRMDGGLTERTCIACGGTGKAKKYVETDGVDHVR